MSTASIVTAAVNDIRTKYLACMTDILPLAADVSALTTSDRSELPRATLRMVAMEVNDSYGKPLIGFNIAAECIYRIAPLTGGQDGEHEQTAQLYLLLLPAELRARPRLQSTAYAAGSGYFSALGIQVEGARIALADNAAGGEILSVVTDIVFTLELQLEEGF